MAAAARERGSMTEKQHNPPPQTLPAEIVSFWQEAGPEKWFEKDERFDETIRQRFGHLPAPARAGDLDSWQSTAEGSLALILTLDQFPRNLYRGNAKAWSFDPEARHIADAAISAGHDVRYPLPLKRFFYIPFMHSEDLAHQQRCLDLCRRADDEEGVKFSQLHLDIIARFGRFPHRNEALSRSTTEEEAEFLESGGFQG